MMKQQLQHQFACMYLVQMLHTSSSLL